MSSGHFDDSVKPGDFTKLQELRAQYPQISVQLRKFRRINHTKQVPYLGGISNDGATVYIDPEVPLGLEGIPVDKLFMIHECIEYALVKIAGLKYEPAHHLATAAEDHVLRELGHTWKKYQSLLRPYYKPVEEEKIENPPKDLALYPYKGRLFKTLWEFQQGKVSKQSVNYRQGTEEKQCGNCSMFRVSTASCTHVVGRILSDDLCDDWEPKRKQ